jgi:hypothetical protein
MKRKNKRYKRQVKDGMVEHLAELFILYKLLGIFDKIIGLLFDFSAILENIQP